MCLFYYTYIIIYKAYGTDDERVRDRETDRSAQTHFKIQMYSFYKVYIKIIKINEKKKKKKED